MTDTHCSDGQLLALIDGDPDGREVEAHVEVCGSCAERMAVLRLDAELVGAAVAGALPSTDPAYDPDFLARLRDPVDLAEQRARRRTGGRRWAGLLAAATLAGLLLTPAVRAWVIETVAPLFGLGPAVETPSLESPGPSQVAALFEGPLLRLGFDGEPGRVEVTFGAADAGVVRAAVAEASGPTEIVTMADGFSFVGASGATIALELPPAVRTLELVVDGAVRWSGPVPETGGAVWVVPWPER